MATAPRVLGHAGYRLSRHIPALAEVGGKGLYELSFDFLVARQGLRIAR